MRLLAVFANIGVVIFIIVMVVVEPPNRNEFFIPILVLLYPILNLFALLRDPQRPVWKDNWLVLYFKRKALEEKKKIEKLEAKTD